MSDLYITHEYFETTLRVIAQRQRDAAQAEVERLKEALKNAITEIGRLQNLASVIPPTITRAEPSRLEIAAMFYAADITAGNINTGVDPDMCPADVLNHADALVKAAKEYNE